MTDTLRTGLAATFSLRTVSRAAFGCLLGAALLMPSTPARAGDNDDSVPIDTKIIRGILEGIGLRKDGEAISYGERAPLVLPQGRALPPPEKSDAVLAKNPAWPNDPDVARRKVEIEQERNRNISEEREHEQGRLSEKELTPGSHPKKQARTDDGYRPGPDGYSNALSPSQLGYKGSIFGSMFGSKTDEVTSFTKEPPRAALTEPPPGYQTPSPDQPYGLSKASTTPKPNNYLETHGTVDGRNY
jgi:hypothetical protein